MLVSFPSHHAQPHLDGGGTGDTTNDAIQSGRQVGNGTEDGSGASGHGAEDAVGDALDLGGHLSGAGNAADQSEGEVGNTLGKGHDEAGDIGDLGLDGGLDICEEEELGVCLFPSSGGIGDLPDGREVTTLGSVDFTSLTRPCTFWTAEKRVVSSPEAIVALEATGRLLRADWRVEAMVWRIVTMDGPVTLVTSPDARVTGNSVSR